MKTSKVLFGLFVTGLLTIASCTTDNASDDSLYEIGIDRRKITKGTDGIERHKITKGTDAIDRSKITKPGGNK